MGELNILFTNHLDQNYQVRYTVFGIAEGNAESNTVRLFKKKGGFAALPILFQL
jgi:hypothetical protein